MKKQIQLPKPTGVYSVGTITYHLVDESRKDMFSHDPEHPFRELMVHVYYPSTDTGMPAPYVSSKLKAHIQERLKEGPFSMGGAGYVDAEVATHAFHAISISNQESPYPVLVFSPGFGGPHYIYTSLLEELASHGYIVAAINHTYTSEPIEFPDGKILRASSEWAKYAQSSDTMEKAMNEEVPTWIADIQFVLDQLAVINQHDPQNILTQKLDLNHIGVLGHSFGGSAAVPVCRIDARCKAGIDIDGPLFGENQDVGFNKPFMFLFAEPFKVDPANVALKEYFEKVIKQNNERLSNLYKSLTNDAYYSVVHATDHMSATDCNIIKDTTGPSNSNPREAMRIIRILLVQFFDKYLKGSSRSVSEGIDTYAKGVELQFRPSR